MTKAEASAAWREEALRKGSFGNAIAAYSDGIDEFKARVRQGITDNTASIESLIATGLADKKIADTIINQNKWTLEMLDTTGPV